MQVKAPAGLQAVNVRRFFDMKSSTRNLVMCALCAAIICVLAPISVPIGPVPISLATFAVMLSGILLGAKWGTIATLVYILLGAVGVPVFAGYSAGVGAIVGQTGGYLVGYLPLALCAGAIYDQFGREAAGAKKYVCAVAGMVVGTAVLYVIGTAWFCRVSGADLGSALGWCVTPFLLGDTIKIVIVTIVAPQIETALKKAGVTFSGEAA